MTANQIAYYKAKQEAKHWKRQDKETKRHDFATEAINSQDLQIKDWANKENVRLGFTNAEINKSHLERQDAINQAHYESSDETARNQGRVANDKLILEAISILGSPGITYTLNEHGEKVTLNPGDALYLPDYYDKTLPSYKFSTTPITLDYLSPTSIAGYGKLLGGFGSIITAVAKAVGK